VRRQFSPFEKALKRAGKFDIEKMWCADSSFSSQTTGDVAPRFALRPSYRFAFTSGRASGMKLSRLGIFTFGSESLFISSFSPMMPLAFRITATSA
jgi:hypothetical protein